MVHLGERVRFCDDLHLSLRDVVQRFVEKLAAVLLRADDLDAAKDQIRRRQGQRLRLEAHHHEAAVRARPLDRIGPRVVGVAGAEDDVGAPRPGLTGLPRSHQRMARRLEVLRRMPAARGVAATDVAAREADPHVDPSPRGLEAFFAPVAARGDGSGLVAMRAADHAIRPTMLHDHPLPSRAGRRLPKDRHGCRTIGTASWDTPIAPFRETARELRRAM